MFLVTDVPRNLVIEHGQRAYVANLKNSPGAGNTSYFVLHNKAAAAATDHPLLLLTSLSLGTESEDSKIRVHRSDDAANLELLTDGNTIENATAAYFDDDLDGQALLAKSTGAPAGVTLRGTGPGIYFATKTDADIGNVLVPLEYPLVLPPGKALVVGFTTAVSSSRVDDFNVCWYRG